MVIERVIKTREPIWLCLNNCYQNGQFCISITKCPVIKVLLYFVMTDTPSEMLPDHTSTANKTKHVHFQLCANQIKQIKSNESNKYIYFKIIWFVWVIQSERIKQIFDLFKTNQIKNLRIKRIETSHAWTRLMARRKKLNDKNVYRIDTCLALS